MHTRTESSINDSLRKVKQEYEAKLAEKDKQMRDTMKKHQEVSIIGYYNHHSYCYLLEIQEKGIINS